MTHKPDRNRKRISTAASIKGLTAVLKCMLASIFLTCLLPASSLYGQKIAVKSNLLYDLTTTFNIGGEIRCDDTHTLNLSVNYNPWNFGGNKKMKHFLVQPEYRKWLNEAFTVLSAYKFTTPYTILGECSLGDSEMVKCWVSKTGRLPTTGIKAIWRASASPMVING